MPSNKDYHFYHNLHIVYQTCPYIYAIDIIVIQLTNWGYIKTKETNLGYPYMHAILAIQVNPGL